MQVKMKLGIEGTWRIKQHVLLFVFVFAGCERAVPRDGCPGSCGNLTIPYPFGTEEGCYHDESFLITCNDTEKPFLRKGDLKVLNISRDGRLRLEFPMSYVCYNDRGNLTQSYQRALTLSNFTLSSERNKFTAIGCDTYAYLRSSMNINYSTGCLSRCDALKYVASAKGSCFGIGCCQISIPKGVIDFSVEAYSFHNHSGSLQVFNPCSYAFIVEDGNFNFSTEYLNIPQPKNTSFPIVLDWYIGNKTCEQVEKSSICSVNGKCVNSGNGPGYLCECLEGYDGNPYLPNGCQDVDECTDETHKNNCAKPEFCINTNGSFYCLCPKGYQGDATKACTRKTQAWTIILLGTTIGFLVFLLSVCCLSHEIRRRKHIKLREKFFEQNGGMMLRRQLSGSRASGVDLKIFTAEELKKASNDYHESRILGEGGQGTVYKGILPDNQEVAIKKARIGDESQVEQFINEVMVLSQINHRNVVKLLGCCLETEAPLLIYEFVTNATLFDHLHKFRSFLPWETRLNIAVETAGTLSYLHSSASVPIIHRDVKSANILMDDKFTAKVSDFGASRLIPADQKELSTLVQGTLGYLDPEYFHTSLLNEKSDVYSFGVVLMELLSGQKALCFDRPENARHLVTYFASALKENRLHEVLDNRVANVENQKHLEEAAWLAVRCTRVKGEERPTMKEVASELEGLKVIAKHKWFDPHPQEVERLLVDQISYIEGDSSNKSNGSGYDSIKNLAGFHIEAGR